MMTQVYVTPMGDSDGILALAWPRSIRQVNQHVEDSTRSLNSSALFAFQKV